MLKWLKIAFAAAGTVITYLFGAFDAVLIALLVFMALDYITGVVKAVFCKSLSSETGLWGIAKKSLIFVVLVMAVFLDRLINGNDYIFRTLVCYFYIANEGVSILENLSEIGVPFPKKIAGVLKQLNNEQEPQD